MGSGTVQSLLATPKTSHVTSPCPFLGRCGTAAIPAQKLTRRKSSEAIGIASLHGASTLNYSCHAHLTASELPGCAAAIHLHGMPE